MVSLRRFALTLVFVLTLITSSSAQISYPPPTISYDGGATSDVCFEERIQSPLTGSVSGGVCTVGLSDSAYASIAQSTLTNDTSTGTLTNGLVKLTGAPSKGVRTATTDVSGVIGVCVSGCGTTSTARIQLAGPTSCVFENATTAGNYVGIGTETAGNCRDMGSSYPVTGQVIGRVLETASAGTRSMLLWGVDLDSIFSRFGPTVDPSELAAPLLLLSGNEIDFNSESSAASLKLPRKTDCSGISNEGKCCWDTDNDVLYCGTASAPLSFLMNPTAVTLIGSIGATGNLLQFGNDTAKFRLQQIGANSFRFGLNTQTNNARDDTGIGGALLGLSASTFTIMFNGVFGPIPYFSIISTQAAGLYLGTNNPTLSWGMRGDQARTMGVERNDTANTAGVDLTLMSGGATSGATDKNGGSLLLRPGVSTGTGTSTLKVQGYARAVSTSTSDNGVNDRITLTGTKAVSDNVAIDIVDINIPSNGMMGGLLLVSCESTNGTEYQVVTGQAMFAGVSKAGTMTCSATEQGADVVASSSGTPTLGFAATTGTNKCVLRVTCDGTVTTTGYPRVSYQVLLNSGFAATVTPL